MKDAKSVVFSQFHGLGVKDMGAFRNKMAEQGIKYHVAKKTLIKLAAKNAGFGDIDNASVEGPVAVAFSMEDELAAAKLIHEFSKKNKSVKLLGSVFEGRLLSVEQTKELATLPSKEELLAKFVYMLKAPIQGFHGVLNNTLASFVRALNAVKEQKEQNA